MGVSNSNVSKLVFLRLGVTDSYLRVLVFLRLGVEILTFGGKGILSFGISLIHLWVSNSYVLGLVFFTFLGLVNLTFGG